MLKNTELTKVRSIQKYIKIRVNNYVFHLNYKNNL
jgi:hypothetical protein